MSYTDVDFVKQLYQDVITSHKLAGLAVNNGTKSAVRQLGANVTDTLRQARDAVRILARKKGVEVSDDLNTRNQDAVDKLSSASGDEVNPASARRAEMTPACAARPAWKGFVMVP